GDSNSSMFAVQSVINMMQKFGIDVPKSRISVKNVAAVMVTADLPFFARPGGRIDVLVSSIGDAKSLSGGTLLATPLTLPNNKVCALAQGAISVGGFVTGTLSGENSFQKNHPTVGRVSDGGLVQYVPPIAYTDGNSFTIVLNDPDFTTASRMATEINKLFEGIAQAIDATSINIKVPESAKNDLVAFISQLENLSVVPDSIAEVVIDEKTGTIVVGKDVRISPVAISHGNLSIQIKTTEEVSQPNPLSNGETVVTKKEEVEVREENTKMKVITGGATIEEVVKALNFIGVSPRDMMMILQAMKKAGALHARLVSI
ncbi:TPA: flagellar basal body P-ring protein FlgI, partial [bacterium]|nr:flagellar basal body P-ring protein FlgI [bacterium]